MPSRGDEVRYRAIAGQVYDAIITGIRTTGIVDIEVIMPGTERRVSLGGLKFNEQPAEWAQVWPRESKR